MARAELPKAKGIMALSGLSSAQVTTKISLFDMFELLVELAGLYDKIKINPLGEVSRENVLPYSRFCHRKRRGKHKPPP
jgi:hypothetical protein